MRRSIFSDPKTMASIGVRSLLWYTPLRRFTFYRYWYNFTPEHLSFFVRCLNQTREVPGDIFEVGCANGHTAVFLNRHLQTAGIDKNYYCLDTFDGFTRDDTTFEVMMRGKNPRELGGFRSNSKKWLEYTLRRNGCQRVYCVRADVEKYDFDRPISFCILDVALYRPTLAALEKTWPKLSPGGLIVVSNCKNGNSFDGAMQGYSEFVQKHGLQSHVVCDRLGLLQKVSAGSSAVLGALPRFLQGETSLFEEVGA
jgi:O-methyltransferase